MKTIVELRKMTLSELFKLLKATIKEAYLIITKVKQGAETKTHLPKAYKKFVARIHTAISEKKLTLDIK